MTDKPNLQTESLLTPEDVVADTYFNRQEKLDRLAEMKHELTKEAARNRLGLDQVEELVAAIHTAMHRVKSDDPAKPQGGIMGRTTSA